LFAAVQWLKGVAYVSTTFISLLVHGHCGDADLCMIARAQ